MNDNPLALLGINCETAVRKASDEALNACVVKIVDPRCAPTPPPPPPPPPPQPMKEDGSSD